jgi:anti-sigma28 factor (negative regulator of flagellin synthesis)
MRIHDVYTKQDRTVRTEGTSPNVSGRPAEGAAGSVGSPGGSVATNVIVSARAKELAASAKPAGARIDALRAQVRDGTFKVDAQSIARHLVGGDEP